MQVLKQDIKTSQNVYNIFVLVSIFHGHNFWQNAIKTIFDFLIKVVIFIEIMDDINLV